MYIYKITNNVNGKVYIGQTVRSIDQRFHRHIKDAHNGLDTHFARAIRKYGSSNFQTEEIDTAQCQDELNQKERYWIQYHDSVNCGYNETDAIYKCGGNTYQQKTPEELAVIKEKIRKTKLGAQNSNARAVKCMNVITGEELFFDTARQCADYFGEKHHRFVTNRVCKHVFGLYKDEWKIAYAEEPYGEFHKAHKKRK